MNKIEIKSDDQGIKLALDDLLGLLKNNGCHFHSDIIITCLDGALGVHAKQAVEVGTNLIGLSERCLLPVEDLTLNLNSEDIVLTNHTSSLSSLRLEITQALINVFNMTKKIGHHVRSHPAILETAETDLYNKLLEGRSATADIYKTNSKNKSDVVIQQMLKSRTMLYQRADKKSSVQTDMIMPVMDFFNHNIEAGSFAKSGVSYDDYLLSVPATVYEKSSMEYFVKYGHFDAYDTFLRYGYVDDSIDFVYSIPITITLPFFVTISINCITGVEEDGFNADKNDIEFLYLTIPVGDDSLSLRHKLYSAIQSVGHARGEVLSADSINAYVQSAEAMIMNKNISFYEELKSYLPNNVDDKSKEVVASATTLIDVQLQKLRAYPYI